ncbi:MAG: hypothetical protein Q7J48_06900 [Nocardioides sp.]|nr:hypothetical protein [Nocardioides sp.]
MKDRPKPSRATVLHNLIEEILARDDGQIPTNIDGTDTYFNNDEDLANALLLRWHTRLVASLERGLVDDPEDRREAVIEAWRHASRIYSGVRRVIDDLAEDPRTDVVAHAVLATARNDWAAMAIAAGLASGIDEPGARVGQRLELEARQRNLTEQSTANKPAARSLLGTLTAHLVKRVPPKGSTDSTRPSGSAEATASPQNSGSVRHTTPN